VTLLNFGNTAVVVERIVAVQVDEPMSGDEAVRVFVAGLPGPIELFVEDPERAYLEICAAISKLTPGKPMASNGKSSSLQSRQRSFSGNTLNASKSNMKSESKNAGSETIVQRRARKLALTPTGPPKALRDAFSGQASPRRDTK